MTKLYNEKEYATDSKTVENDEDTVSLVGGDDNELVVKATN